jgi:hypothetical protein
MVDTTWDPTQTTLIWVRRRSLAANVRTWLGARARRFARRAPAEPSIHRAELVWGGFACVSVGMLVGVVACALGL